MKGLDTNLLVRYLTRDDDDQYQKAKAYLEAHCTQNNPCLVNNIVLCELVWVLQSVYKQERSAIISVLEKLLRTKQLSFFDKDAARAALRDFKKSKADFSDCLIGRLNTQAGCNETASFDQATDDLDTFALL